MQLPFLLPGSGCAEVGEWGRQPVTGPASTTPGSNRPARRGNKTRGEVRMSEGSVGATIPEFLLGHPLKSLVREVVDQDRKSNTICDLAVNFQEEV